MAQVKLFVKQEHRVSFIMKPVCHKDINVGINDSSYTALQIRVTARTPN